VGLMDRHWYRADQAQRERRIRRSKRRHALKMAALITVTVLSTLAVLPVAVTPRCGFAAWQTEPIACWQWSWAALRAQVAENMEATRGFPLAVIRVDGHQFARGPSWGR
jgi:hypothetical protein